MNDVDPHRISACFDLGNSSDVFVNETWSSLFSVTHWLRWLPPRAEPLNTAGLAEPSAPTAAETPLLLVWRSCWLGITRLKRVAVQRAAKLWGTRQDKNSAKRGRSVNLSEVGTPSGAAPGRTERNTAGGGGGRHQWLEALVCLTGQWRPHPPAACQWRRAGISPPSAALGCVCVCVSCQLMSVRLVSLSHCSHVRFSVHQRPVQNLSSSRACKRWINAPTSAGGTEWNHTDCGFFSLSQLSNRRWLLHSNRK